jgi:hypothetical protein
MHRGPHARARPHRGFRATCRAWQWRAGLSWRWTSWCQWFVDRTKARTLLAWIIACKCFVRKYPKHRPEGLSRATNGRLRGGEYPVRTGGCHARA